MWGHRKRSKHGDGGRRKRGASAADSASGAIDLVSGAVPPINAGSLDGSMLLGKFVRYLKTSCEGGTSGERGGSGGEGP